MIIKIYGKDGKKNIVGNRIKKARTDKNISQSELAARLQVQNVVIEQKAVSRIELGERLVTDYELFAMSKALNVSVLWLLDKPEN